MRTKHIERRLPRTWPLGSDAHAQALTEKGGDGHVERAVDSSASQNLREWGRELQILDEL